jgi:hypothetical protein
MNEECVCVSEDEIACPNVLGATEKDGHCMCDRFGNAPLPLVPDEAEYLLCACASFNRKPYTVKLTIEDECRVGFDEWHVAFCHDVFVAKCAAGMCDEKMHLSRRAKSVLPDGLHGAVTIPCIPPSHRAAPTVSLEFGTGSAYLRKGIEVATDIDGFPRSDRKQPAHCYTGWRPANSSAVVSGNPHMIFRH